MPRPDVGDEWLLLPQSIKRREVGVKGCERGADALHKRGSSQVTVAYCTSSCVASGDAEERLSVVLENTHCC